MYHKSFRANPQISERAYRTKAVIGGAMSKDFTKEDVITNKKTAIKELNKLLEHYINDPSEAHLKKANLISYWLKDYVRFLNFEEQFDPKRNIAYKRGNIVKINFGFNIGSEYGGLHYGVVLDNHNDLSSPILTVIPLTSVKDNKEVHKNNVVLGNELYRLLKIKYDTINQNLKEEQTEITTTLQAFASLLSLSSNTAKELATYDKGSNEFSQKLSAAHQYLEDAKSLQAIWEKKKKHNQAELEYLNKIGQEISQMKEGSIALINQITTVSKIRIFDPRNWRGVLSGISLSEESMIKINRKFKELYVFD